MVKNILRNVSEASKTVFAGPGEWLMMISMTAMVIDCNCVLCVAQSMMRMIYRLASTNYSAPLTVSTNGSKRMAPVVMDSPFNPPHRKNDLNWPFGRKHPQRTIILLFTELNGHTHQVNMNHVCNRYRTRSLVSPKSSLPLVAALTSALVRLRRQ